MAGLDVLFAMVDKQSLKAGQTVRHHLDTLSLTKWSLDIADIDAKSTHQNDKFTKSQQQKSTYFQPKTPPIG